MIQEAMEFAMEAHKGQFRKYTGDPYYFHLAEVAGLMLRIISFDIYAPNLFDSLISIAWLHDVMEDCNITHYQLGEKFNYFVADGVKMLSDLEEENRETRKKLSRERLAKAPRYIQSIKVADMISNTASIVKHDPKFAVTYLEEKRLMLDVLTKADQILVEIAREIIA